MFKCYEKNTTNRRSQLLIQSHNRATSHERGMSRLKSSSRAIQQDLSTNAMRLGGELSTVHAILESGQTVSRDQLQRLNHTTALTDWRIQEIQSNQEKTRALIGLELFRVKEVIENTIDRKLDCLRSAQGLASPEIRNNATRFSGVTIRSAVAVPGTRSQDLPLYSRRNTTGDANKTQRSKRRVWMNYGYLDVFSKSKSPRTLGNAWSDVQVDAVFLIHPRLYQRLLQQHLLYSRAQWHPSSLGSVPLYPKLARADFLLSMGMLFGLCEKIVANPYALADLGTFDALRIPLEIFNLTYNSAATLVEMANSLRIWQGNKRFSKSTYSDVEAFL